MRTSARCAILISGLAATSCASMIKPQYIDPRVYSELTCDQLHSEYTQTSVWLAQWSGHEAKTGVQNVGSIVLFGLPMPLTSMHPSQIASLKGRLIALQSVATDKQCGKLE